MPARSQTVHLPKVFDFDAYALTLAALKTAIERGYRRLILDFSESERAFPNGMVPLIASCMYWRESQNLTVGFVPPRQPRLKRVFEAVGWADYLASTTAEFRELSPRVSNFTPVRPFGPEELGTLHGSIMDVLMGQTPLASGLPDALDWALWEVMDNVLNHASVVRGWVQAATFREHRHVNILVVDSGVGIGASLSPRHPQLSEREAIKLAVEKGETRDPSKYKGYGLFGCREIAIQSGGRLLVSSGGWLFVQEGRKPGGGVRREPHKRYLPLMSSHHGTVVELVLRSDRMVDLAKALGRDTPIVSVLWPAHEGGAEIRFDVSKEALDLGTREAGRRLRNKLLNLIHGRDERVVLDFRQVRMVSSSFADEFVAKLARRVGRSRFASEFELRGMNPSVNTVVQIALWERARPGG